MAVPSRLVAPGSAVRFRPPRFGLGGSHLGEADEQTALATVDAAYQAGIRFFDTSPAYGESEARLGAALRSRPRGEFLVSTRVVGDDPEQSLRESGERLGLALDLIFLPQEAVVGAQHLASGAEESARQRAQEDTRDGAGAGGRDGEPQGVRAGGPEGARLVAGEGGHQGLQGGEERAGETGAGRGGVLLGGDL
ncbi:aldo/keto reductase, partial [Kribbella sp.]|uniref:aldo/keto reductase n=1 Tax=Kribbella sp. TaxID=1871183 RepID=UPI002D641CD6